MFGRKKPVSTPQEIVDAIDAQFPMPEGEIKRLNARRWIFDRVKKGGIGAEIGVFRGHFSALICQTVAPRRLYLVDPWRLVGAHFGWGKDYTNHNALTTQAAYDQTKARMALHPDVETIMIEGFYPACDHQIPELLDFAYLDASHSYESTLAELRCLQDRIKPGGYILGDDWRPDPKAVHHGVYKAVQDFVGETDWEVMFGGHAGQWALCRAADRQR